MKTENEFNAFVTKQIQKLGSSYKAIKASDRFHIGISDWLIYHDGKAIAVESKFIKKRPKSGKLLQHVITGPQITFLKTMELAGTRGFVIIGMGDLGQIAVIPTDNIPKEGNYNVKDLNAVRWYFFNEIERMLDFMFSGAQNDD